MSTAPPPSPAPTYSAELPWLGPMLGPLRAEDPVVPIGAASDPLLGDVLAAALVPVRRRAGRLEPVREGAGIRAWIVPCRSPAEGCLRIAVPRDWWRDADGVLMLLVYDYSSLVDAQLPATLDAQIARFAPALKRGSEPLAVRELPEPMRKEIRRALEGVLRAPKRSLEDGVVELMPPGGSGFAFAVASCQYPAGFLDGEPAERSYRKLARCLERRDPALRPRLVLLLGDQIYADATAGLFDPSAEHDRFDLPHQRLLAMPSFRSIARRVPVHAMLDDHEIEDNWEPTPGDAENAEKLDKGRAAYVRYQRLADPRIAPGGTRLWHHFEADGVPFFVADTRTGREPRDAASVERAHIMDEEQLLALLAWLDAWRESPAPKFIACPALPLPRHRRAAQHGFAASALRSDAWDGYPATLERLLMKIVEAQVSHVVFLSGDEHLSLVARATLRVDGHEPVVVHSVHSSALYAPYPFANSIDEELAADEPFRLGACRVDGVTTRFAAPGDGFAVLQVLRDDGRWLTRCRFLRGPRAPGSAKWIELAA
jgi:hypothetical protein